MKKEYAEFDHYTFNGQYAVRCYDRRGNGVCVHYVNTLEEAEKIRTEHGLSIGLEPEPTYRHFAYYPTIWKWVDDDAEVFEPSYNRVLGY